MNLWIVGFSNVHTQIGRGLLLPYFEIPAMREPKRRNEEKSRFRALFLCPYIKFKLYKAMEKVSLLMRDSSEEDSQKETMMDFILSWTLRRTMQQYSNEKPHLYQNCRYILGNLIGVEMTDNVQVVSVETWKQHKRIDLWVNVRLVRNGKEELHAVLIENKAYTSTHDDQLARYKTIFDQECDEYIPEAKRHYVLITALDEKPEALQNECDKNKYELHCLSDLNDWKQPDTESDLFNEFWLRYW